VSRSAGEPEGARAESQRGRASGASTALQVDRNHHSTRRNCTHPIGLLFGPNHLQVESWGALSARFGRAGFADA
jgi:hypothetical protein